MNGTRSTRRFAAATLLVGPLLAPLVGGCSAPPRDLGAIRAYYDYDFATARERLRDDRRDDEQALLADMRLGMAALADGNAVEAERALGRAFDLLSTAGLNADRTTAAVLLHEGVRIWKGEPFEQALAYHAVATLYAVLGDWENARAAAANALFRLADFGADAARTDDYTPVDTSFTLGFLMQAIASGHAGAGGGDELFDAALAIDPELAPLVESLRANDYDTLLIVDFGKGPTKVAHGRDGALAAFAAQDPPGGTLVVRVDDVEAARVAPVCDVATMAADYRWRHLEGARVAKSIAGDLLMTSGIIVAHHGRDEGPLIGGLMLVAGLLAKAGARADTRYLEFVPRSIYLVPLRLGSRRDLRATVAGGGATVSLPAVVPGTTAAPRAVYLRVHGADSPRPPWLASGVTRYGNDHTGVRPGDYPWILGGADVSTPTRATLEAYQAGGRLTDMTTADLVALYEAEGIVFGPEATGANDRHVLDGGSSLFTPLPDSMGYRRLMAGSHAPYQPRSELVRNAARRIRVHETLTRDALRPDGTLDDWLAEEPE